MFIVNKKLHLKWLALLMINFVFNHCQSQEYVFNHSLCFALSHVSVFLTLLTVVCQAPLSMGFPRQEYWSGLPSPSPRDLPNPGIKPASLALAGGFFTTEPPGKYVYINCNQMELKF